MRLRPQGCRTDRAALAARDQRQLVERDCLGAPAAIGGDRLEDLATQRGLAVAKVSE